MFENKFLLFLILSTILFSLALAYQLLPLGIEGEWTWSYQSFLSNSKILFSLAVFFILIFWVKRFLDKMSNERLDRKRELKFMVIVSLFTFFITLSLFSQNRFGLLELALIINHPGATGYLSVANKIGNINYFLHNYLNFMPYLGVHAETHPPGIIFLFWLVLKMVAQLSFLKIWLVNSYLFWGYNLNDLVSGPGSLTFLTSGFLIGLLLPLIGSLTVFPLYYLGKELYNQRVAVYACLLYILIPSLIMFTPTVDQTYPFLATFVIWLFYRGLKRGQAASFFISGILLSFGIVLSFTFLALFAPLVILSIYSYGRFFPSKKNLFWRGIIAFLVSFAVPFGFIFLVFHLNIVTIFLKAMSINKESYGLGTRTYSKWVSYNLYDFFSFAGLPISLLMFKRVISHFKEICQKRFPWDPLLVAFLVTLLFLNFSGINLGEVARLWIFLIPLLALVSAQAIKNWGSKSCFALTVVLALQFLQAVAYKVFVRTIVY
ncbi:MAG: glycosyltransferase family 39 protein [Nitrospirae bacterium]|nr:glycosyltransferase family 39 protein [Nitrospirota bacterium]